MNVERADLAATVKVVRGGQEIAFVASNSATAWRAQSVMSKEPGTVSWIEEFAAGEIFVEVGGSCHTFGADVDHNLQQRAPAFRQGCFATTLDALVADGVVPVPQHIKIDVDGLEHAVIRGAAATIADPGVRSVLFLRTDRSFHGVEEIRGECIERNVLLYNIYARKTGKTDGNAAARRWAWPWRL